MKCEVCRPLFCIGIDVFVFRLYMGDLSIVIGKSKMDGASQADACHCDFATPEAHAGVRQG
jgi:hypothetical protein